MRHFTLFSKENCQLKNHIFIMMVYSQNSVPPNISAGSLCTQVGDCVLYEVNSTLLDAALKLYFLQSKEVEGVTPQTWFILFSN